MKKSKAKIVKQLKKEIEILKDKKGFIRAGLPRFNRLFGRDSLIVSWQLLGIKPEICKNTLAVLSKLQGKKFNKTKEEEPGKIIHEMDFQKPYHFETKLPYPYYGSVDSTPLFLILFAFYFKKTKDKIFLKKYWKNILAALNWIINYGDKDNDLFIEYKKKSKIGLFHQGWKDGFSDHLGISPPVAIVEAQGYKYLALIEIAKLAKIFNDRILSNSLINKAESLKKEFNKKFWMKNKKYYCLALDDKKRQKKSITSNPGHLLFTGIIEKNKEKFLVKKLFQKELWTSFGIRTHSMKEPDFEPQSYHLGSIWPHDNWIIAQGLKKLGYKREYKKIKKALFQAYLEIGFLPEFYEVINNRIILSLKKVSCYPQAWATGALLNFLNSRLNILP